MNPHCTVTQEARGCVPGHTGQLAFAYWPGAGTPIVAIPGMTSNALFFNGVAERLAGRRPLLAFDLRGRGDADKPAEGYGLEQHAADVAAAMQAFGVDRAMIVGHSFGASVATVLAGRHPEMCAGIVLYDGGHHALAATLTDGAAVQEFARSSAAIDLRMHTTFATGDAYYDYWRALPIFRDDQWGPWVERYLEYDLGGSAPDLRPKCAPEAVAADAQDLLATIFGSIDTHIDAPVLELCADQGLVDDSSPIVSDAALELMGRAFGSFQAERFPQTNHYTIALADPAATLVAEHLVAFAISCRV